jgi:hypothetical protein
MKRDGKHNAPSTYRPKKGHQQSQKALPIENYELDSLSVFVNTQKETQQESVIILKRTLKQFIYHADDYYRDSGSKRNNFVNDEALPGDKGYMKFFK